MSQRTFFHIDNLRHASTTAWLASWAGCRWRGLPHDLPPWETVYQQRRRWSKAGVFEAMCHDSRALLHLVAGRAAKPTAAIFDGRTSQSNPESGARAGYDGPRKENGSRTHVAVDTLGHLPALHVAAANEQARDQVEVLAVAVQEVTGNHGQLAYVDQGYTGETAAQAAAAHGIALEVVRLAEAKKGFVLLPGRRVVGRSCGWVARCRRLARDHERLPTTLAGLTRLFFASLLLTRFHL